MLLTSNHPITRRHEIRFTISTAAIPMPRIFESNKPLLWKARDSQVPTSGMQLIYTHRRCRKATCRSTGKYFRLKSALGAHKLSKRRPRQLYTYQIATLFLDTSSYWVIELQAFLKAVHQKFVKLRRDTIKWGTSICLGFSDIDPVI